MYMGHRRFLPLNHALRKRGKFKGKAEHQTKPGNRSGKDVFNMVKDVQVVFGKGPDSQPVPNDANGHTHPCEGRSPYFGSYPTGRSYRSVVQST
jgi:hypothetical protein